MFHSLASHNDKLDVHITRFHSKVVPPLSIEDYLIRIVKYGAVEPVCLLSSVLYLDRICQRCPTFTLSSLTMHRFLITAITCASKILSDTFYTNAVYAKIGGLSTQELNILEMEFLKLIDWEVNVNMETLQEYYFSMAKQQCSVLY
ncbi:cyclin-domain-containing protein, partial [Gorgonomyces haynaldii]